MKTPNQTPKSKSLPQPPPHRLRDDPIWQGHYNAILTGLYARFKDIDAEHFDSPKEAFEALSQRLEHLTMIAYQGACHAHCYSHMAERYSDAELAQFVDDINTSNHQ